jgi:hypothetical protein
VRVALCDDDGPLVALVEDLVIAQGHDIIGIADTSVAAVHLVEHGHPDLLVVDPSVGINSDFDVIATACAVGALTVVFSRNAAVVVAKHYEPTPLVVPKPDLAALEVAISRVGQGDSGRVAAVDRRSRPVRAASGPAPSGLHDASAFYSALNDAVGGDALVAFVVAEPSDQHQRDLAAERISSMIRDGDRTLVAGWAVVVLMPGSGDAGVAALLKRLADGAITTEMRAASVVLGPNEVGADALMRLRAETSQPSA